MVYSITHLTRSFLWIENKIILALKTSSVWSTKFILNIGNLLWESFLVLFQLEPAFLYHSLRK